MAALFSDPDEALAADLAAERALVSRLLANGVHVYGAATTMPLVFEDIFPGPFDEDATSDALRVASVHREEVREAMASPGGGAPPDPRGIVGALRQYFPDIWSLTESLRTAGTVGKVKLNMRGTLRFTWTSVLDRESRSTSKWGNQTFVFEIVMVLAQLGLAHADVAANCAAAGDLPGAARTLRQGAGILQFVCVEVLPKWRARPKNKLPLEVEVDVLDACARIMLAQSQQLAVAKALSASASGPKKGLAPATLAKLCMGCHQMMTEAAASLRKLPKAEFERLDHGLLECAGFWLKIYEGLALRFLSRASHTGERWGEACALARRATNVSDTVATLQYASLVRLNEDVVAWKASVRTWQQRYVKENESAYFDLPEPGADRLPRAAAQILGSAKCEPFVVPAGGQKIVNFVSSELMRKDAEHDGGAIQVEKKDGGGVAKKESADAPATTGSKTDDADLENAVSVLMAMGFDEKRARKVLPGVGNDVRRAIEELSGEPDASASAGEAKFDAGGKQRFNVTIPAGLKAGESVAMPLPSGKQHVLKIPAGYDPTKPMDVVVEV